MSDPLDDELARIAADVEAYLKRTRDRLAFRESEGRRLSKANRAVMRKTLLAIQELMDATRERLEADNGPED